ncbi:Phosphoglycerate dehydrogenase [Planctomycetales bacterium 10988]|nr:Phosphoglycerate dehydrogenase [Planctomycetales bacterium 10988]
MPRVLVTPPLLWTEEWPYRAILESAGCEIVHPAAIEPIFQTEGIIEALQGIDAIIAGVEPFTEEIFARTKLKVVARVGVGYDAVDVPAATKHGVIVTITPGTNEHSVAEQAISLMVGVYRGFPYRDQSVRNGTWNRALLPRLAGKKLGLIGLGRIGQAVVPRAKGLGLEILAYDPFVKQSFVDQFEIQLRSLEELLAESDIVSLHLPATAETHHLIRAETLRMMKPGSVLINTARGALVKEDDLAAAVASGHLMGAGLDVFEQEPLPLDHPFMKLDRVLLSPHTGGLDQQSLTDMSNLSAQCVADLAQGVWPEPCVVNPEVKVHWEK